MNFTRNEAFFRTYKMYAYKQNIACATVQVFLLITAFYIIFSKILKINEKGF